MHSAQLMLPGGSNKSVSVDDCAVFMPKSTLGVLDGWICVAYLNTSSGTSTSEGATGAPGNYAFYENDMTVTGDYTLRNNKNAMSAGPMTIETGVTVTIPTGATWTIV